MAVTEKKLGRWQLKRRRFLHAVSKRSLSGRARASLEAFGDTVQVKLSGEETGGSIALGFGIDSARAWAASAYPSSRRWIVHRAGRKFSLSGRERLVRTGWTRWDRLHAARRDGTHSKIAGLRRVNIGCWRRRAGLRSSLVNARRYSRSAVCPICSASLPLRQSTNLSSCRPHSGVTEHRDSAAKRETSTAADSRNIPSQRLRDSAFEAGAEGTGDPASQSERDPKKPAVYVGMTGLPVDHRFENHKHGYKSADSLGTMACD